ncbi:MAG: relaxase domain-containing protein [Oculatellaceae cyanobacterium Prado106]|jgi:hypothetical protein|nr:relaxase domain-containing protein [Oculatellaceae cyanobacterium Prado106]
MLFPNLKSKASKGSVQIKTSNGRLQLVFSYAGKRHYLSLGFSDTKTHRKLAEAKARQLELDMLSGHFDPTLERYKPQVALSVAAPDMTPKVTPSISLADLWEGFIEYKRPQCSENTMYYVYQHFTTYMEKLPTHDLSKAGEIRDFSVQTFPLESCKRFIVRLSACCEWAKKSRLIEENPFTGMAKEIKPPKAQRKTEEEDINPFSIEERDRVLLTISEDTFCNRHSGFKHSFYAPYVEFMFMTGCRPSEAIAHQKLLGEIYQNELAFQLRQQGYEIEHCGTGQFELKGYSQALINVFSTRTQQIEKYLEKLQSNSDRPLSASQKKQATLATRKTKKVVPREVLMSAWEGAIAHQNLRLPHLPEPAAIQRELATIRLIRDVRVARVALKAETDLKEVIKLVAQSPILRQTEQARGRDAALRKRVAAIGEARRQNFVEAQQKQEQQRQRQKGVEMD